MTHSIPEGTTPANLAKFRGPDRSIRQRPTADAWSCAFVGGTTAFEVVDPAGRTRRKRLTPAPGSPAHERGTIYEDPGSQDAGAALSPRDPAGHQARQIPKQGSRRDRRTFERPSRPLPATSRLWPPIVTLLDIHRWDPEPGGKQRQRVTFSRPGRHDPEVSRAPRLDLAGSSVAGPHARAGAPSARS